MRTREDWLYDQLDNGKLSDSVRTKYEAELDQIANRRSETQAQRQELKQAEAARVANIRAMLVAGNLDVIDTFGMEEFGEDYETIVEGSEHIVYSKVARDDQASRHALPTQDDARAKLRKLVWDRLYTKYVRSGELDHLSELAKE